MKSVHKYGAFSGPYFPVFGLNTEIYGVNSVSSPNTRKFGPEKTPYLDAFYAVFKFVTLLIFRRTVVFFMSNITLNFFRAALQLLNISYSFWTASTALNVFECLTFCESKAYLENLTWIYFHKKAKIRKKAKTLPN